MLGKYGNYELNRSQSNPEDRYKRTWTQVKDLDEVLAGQEVMVRGRVHQVRDQKLGAFLVIREQFSTVQAIVFEAQTSYGMKTFAHKIPKESIIDVKAKVNKPDQAIKGTSQQVELHVTELWIVNASAPILPFQLEDASARVENQELEDKPYLAESKDEEKKGDEKHHNIVN